MSDPVWTIIPLNYLHRAQIIYPTTSNKIKNHISRVNTDLNKLKLRKMSVRRIAVHYDVISPYSWIGFEQILRHQRIWNDQVIFYLFI